MKLFTSLAVVLGSLGEREEGQSLVQETSDFLSSK